jgi:hypothetical protein
LLTGTGAPVPVPSVLRLIDLLAKAGAKGNVQPACPHCGRLFPSSSLATDADPARSCAVSMTAGPRERDFMCSQEEAILVF